MTPTDQIALTAFVEPESYSSRAARFAGNGSLVEGRLGLSRPRTFRTRGKITAFTASRERVKLRGLRNRRLKPMRACAPQSGGRSPCDADDDN